MPARWTGHGATSGRDNLDKERGVVPQTKTPVFLAWAVTDYCTLADGVPITIVDGKQDGWGQALMATLWIWVEYFILYD
jgi:hypothetical protein